MKLQQSAKSLLKKLRAKKYKLKERGIYAIVAGVHIGDFYLSHEWLPEQDKHVFIQLPDFKTVILTTSTITLGLSSGVMDFVKVIPKNVYEVIVREWEGRSNDSTNRWPQHAPQDALGSTKEQLSK